MRRGVRKHRLLVVLLAIGVLIAGCSSSKSSSSSSSSAASGTVAPADDVGITATTIHVGLIADVNTSVEPGLFQKNVDAMNAWATLVNKAGGIAGRQVVVDFCDSKLDPNTTTNCVIQACAKDFALVGTGANALTDLPDIDTCKNAQGQSIGIPNLAFVGFFPVACDPLTYLQSGQGSYCKTMHDNPQTYTENIGDFQYYVKNNTGLHGIWVYDGDVPAIKITSVPGFQLGANLGIGKDGQGFYAESGAAPQSALTPIVLQMKNSKSTFGYGGAIPAQTVLIRREAQLQGVNTVKVWAANSGIYDTSFLAQGGATVNGEYTSLLNLPFYTEYKDNPSLNALVTQLGGVNKLNNNALASYTQALLFQDAVNKAIANGGTLNRQSLINALNNEHSFNAQGIIGATDIGNRTPSPCVVVMQVDSGAFKRVYPSQAGTFDCDKANVGTIQMNLNS